MQNDSNVETPQVEIPAYLQCEPRTYTLKSKSKFDDIIEFKINILIKCTDEHVSQVFNSVFDNHSGTASKYFKLYKNNNLEFFLNIIAWLASDFCIERINDWNNVEQLQKHILNQGILLGFLDCFEIKAVDFEWFLNYDHFEIVVENAGGQSC